MNQCSNALLAEAFRIVDDGIASPEDVDIAIKHGHRNAVEFMGPFETIDLNAPGGVIDYCEGYVNRFRCRTSTR